MYVCACVCEGERRWGSIPAEARVSAWHQPHRNARVEAHAAALVWRNRLASSCGTTRGLVVTHTHIHTHPPTRPTAHTPTRTHPHTLNSLRRSLSLSLWRSRSFCLSVSLALSLARALSSSRSLSRILSLSLSRLINLLSWSFFTSTVDRKGGFDNFSLSHTLSLTLSRESYGALIGGVAYLVPRRARTVVMEKSRTWVLRP
jgi:hypothetical protein